MSIDCSNNSTFNTKKAELESQVASLASAGSSAMAAVKAKGGAVFTEMNTYMGADICVAQVVEDVIPTIVAREQQVSISRVTTKSFAQLYTEKKAYDDEVVAYKKTFTLAVKTWFQNERKIMKTPAWKKILDKIAKQNISQSEFYNSQASSSEKTLIEEYWTGFNEAKRAQTSQRRVDEVDTFWELQLHLKDGISEPTGNYTWNQVKFENGKMTIVPSKLNTTQIDADIKSIYEKHKEAVIAYRAYFDAKSL